MSKYVVFVTEDEEAWEARSEAERQEVYDADARFVRLLSARRQGDRRRRAEPPPAVDTLEQRSGVTRRTTGPYAESVEQLGGFYVVSGRRRGAARGVRRDDCVARAPRGGPGSRVRTAAAGQGIWISRIELLTALMAEAKIGPSSAPVAAQ